MAIAVAVSAVTGVLLFSCASGDDTIGSSPTGITGEIVGTEPSGRAPTSPSSGGARDLGRVVDNVRALAAADVADCPISDDAVDSIGAAAASPLVTLAIAGGIVEVDATPPGPSGASMVQCSAGSSEAAFGLFVGTLGDLDVRTWIAEDVGIAVELAAAGPLDGEPTSTFELTNELGRIVGAAWSKDGFVATVAAFASDANADVRPAGMRDALTGSLDTILTELVAAQPPPRAVTTVPATTDTTLPSATPVDTTAALAGVDAATRAGQGEGISCPIDPGTMTSFGDQIDGEFFASALRDEPIFGASVWLRDESSGASAFRCSTSGANGLVGMYVGDLGGLGLEGWLQVMGGPYALEGLGTNRGGTVYAVSAATAASEVVGSLWTDERLVVMVLGIEDPGVINVTAADTAPGLMSVLQGVIHDLAQQ